MCKMAEHRRGLSAIGLWLMGAACQSSAPTPAVQDASAVARPEAEATSGEAPSRPQASPDVAAVIAEALLAPGPALPSEASPDVAVGPEQCDPGRDRAAILQMAGTYGVTFRFDEHGPIANDYVVQEPYESEALETVSILQDTPKRVVLQHVLLIEKHDGSFMPLKHWRQDWTFEDTDLLEFRGERIWAHRMLTPDQARCTWSQAVYQVDDAPRYESHAPWIHTAQVSTWTSTDTFRPLPRREYTHRDDYDVIVAHNVHIVHPRGWEHVQRNLKWVSRDQRALVREHGRNRYVRTEVPAEVRQVVDTYLTRTAPFWSEVRTVWSELLSPAKVRILAKREEEALYEVLFPLADNEDGQTPQGAALSVQLRELMRPWVIPEDGPAQALRRIDPGPDPARLAQRSATKR